MNIPNLAGVATADLVEKIGGSGFQASYINWSRTLHMLREHAPGWLPELVSGDSGIVHNAPVGAFLLIRFRHTDGTVTPEVPQAIMDARNAAIPLAKITARDITDTHRRGVCMAAALTFGLAYELWAKMPLESGYAAEPEKPVGRPLDGAWEALSEDEQAAAQEHAAILAEYMAEDDAQGAVDYLDRISLTNEQKTGLWTLLPRKTRSAIKKELASRK